MKILQKIFEWITGLTLWQVAYLALMLLFYSTAIAFYASLVTGAIEFYNVVTAILSLASGISSGGGVSSKFFGLLSCSGVTSGINASKPFLFSSIIFLFLKVSFLLFLQAYSLILREVSRVLRM